MGVGEWDADLRRDCALIRADFHRSGTKGRSELPSLVIFTFHARGTEGRATYHDNWMKVQTKRKGFRFWKFLRRKSLQILLSDLWNSLRFTIRFVSLCEELRKSLDQLFAIFLLFLLVVFSFGVLLLNENCVILARILWLIFHSIQYFSFEEFFGELLLLYMDLDGVLRWVEF